MTDYSPRIDRCKRCQKPMTHHRVLYPRGDSWWACVGCGARRPTLTKTARALTDEESRADEAMARASLDAAFAAMHGADSDPSHGTPAPEAPPRR